jgi:uncharacterized protein (TIGR03083 family)
MNVETTRPVDEITPISRAGDARQIALAAYDRLIDLLETLDAEDWRAPTECPAWDVAAMVGHLIGAAKAGARTRENLRQQLWAKRHADEFGGNTLDAANERQVRDHAKLTPAERITALREVAPAAVAGRMRLPRPLRRVTVPLDPGGSTADGMPARLSLGHLVDVVYTRDVWLHTVDIARATSRPFPTDTAIDDRIIEDIVAEWASRHDQPFVLVLTGPRTVRFHQGQGGGRLHLDAVEFCRVLSGRAQPDDIEMEAQPTHTKRLLETRVVF